ncbi:MAG: family 43 glycosylhydrolase [Kiritimatiellae bacterium]|nr:family 43 glycosylhydrolase [Kiritimatiellia bacterium]
MQRESVSTKNRLSAFLTAVGLLSVVTEILMPLRATAESHPCAKISFKPMPSPMQYGDTTRCGAEHPFAKDPTVIRHNGRYLMYYSVCAYDKAHRPRDLGEKPGGWWGAVAESSDLVHWKRIGDIEIEGSKFISAAVAPCVKKIDGKIHMFHQARHQAAEGKKWYYTSKNALIWHATSEDGIHFKCADTKPAFAPQNKWSIDRAIDAEFYRVGDRLMLMYATREKPDAKIQRLGIAWAPYESDWALDKWTELSIEKPFFEPELPWEMKCIEAPTVVERNGIWYMFYAGAYNHERQQIGVAWSSDGVNFKRWRDTPVFPHGKPGTWNAWESGHPGLFVDDDGRVYLFYQGKATLKGDYQLSCTEVVFED